MHITPQAIHPTKIHAGAIAEYSDVWDDRKINYWIDVVERLHNDPTSKVKFQRAEVFDEGRLVESKIRTNSNLFVTESGFNGIEEMRILNNEFLDLVDSAVKSYKDILGIKENTYYNEGFNLLRYEGGEHYDAHYDGPTGSGRSISPILYINDDYEGGELEFVHFDLKIKPKRGTLYLFPASYPYTHIAHSVESGTKYAIVTWLHDRPNF